MNSWLIFYDFRLRKQCEIMEREKEINLAADHLKDLTSLADLEDPLLASHLITSELMK